MRVHQQVAGGRFEQRSDAETKAWLRCILARTLVDLLRRFGAGSRDVALERSLQAELDEDSARLERQPEADQSSPSEILMRLEQAARLREALGQLSAGQREALDLTKLQGLTLDQAAQRMGLTKDAVARLIRRGLEKPPGALLLHEADRGRQPGSSRGQWAVGSGQ
jgi:RNA polymerase sigma factor (sigma-70 family)